MIADSLSRLQTRIADRYSRLVVHSGISGNDDIYFLWALKRFWTLLNDEPITAGILAELEVGSSESPSNQSTAFYRHQTELSQAIHCYETVKALIATKSPTFPHDEPVASQEVEAESYRNAWVAPLVQFIIDRIDERDFLLSALATYKQKVEWFPANRESLLEAAKDGSSTAEAGLKLHTMEYLHDRGIRITREPESPSGIADFLLRRHGEDRYFVVEAKVFDPTKGGKPSIVKGFKQVYTYLAEHNETLGCLLVDNTSARDLCFDVPGRTGSLQSLTYNGRTIILLEIDIAEHPKSASKSGKLAPTTITESEFIGSLVE